MQRKKDKHTSRRKTLRFVTDVSLRRKIEDAIEITSFLYLKRNEKGVSEGFAKEIRRMEILYAASIIEAVLIHVFKRRGESIFRTDYKDVYPLPETYQSDLTSRLVVARQFQKPKLDRELTLDTLIDFFSEKEIIGKQLKGKVDATRMIRNTFHLAKSRKGVRCGIKSVDSAYDALVEILSVAKGVLAKELPASLSSTPLKS